MEKDNIFLQFSKLKNEKHIPKTYSQDIQSYEFDSEVIKDILSEIKNLNLSGKNTQKDIESLRGLNLFLQAVVAILIAVMGIFIPLVFNLHANRIDKAIENQRTIIEKEIQALKENTSMQIQRDVAIEASRFKK